MAKISTARSKRFSVSAAVTAALLLAGLSIGVSTRAAAAPVFEFGLGTNLTYFSYQEVLTAPAKSTETAVFGTLAAMGRIYVYNDSFLQLRGDFGRNIQSQYDGTALKGGSAVQAVDVLGFTNLEVDAYVELTERIFLYVGYGYRNWDRFLSGGQGYREVYTWSYTPIGALFWVKKDHVFDMGVDISYRPTSNGTINVITSQTYANGQDSTMNLGSKPGYKIMLPTKYFVNAWTVLTTLWYEHSEIGQSNLVANQTLSADPNTGILEPDSKTDQFGVDVIISYTF